VWSLGRELRTHFLKEATSYEIIESLRLALVNIIKNVRMRVLPHF
jgi:hypothetical protein